MKIVWLIFWTLLIWTPLSFASLTIRIKLFGKLQTLTPRPSNFTKGSTIALIKQASHLVNSIVTTCSSSARACGTTRNFTHATDNMKSTLENNTAKICSLSLMRIWAAQKRTFNASFSKELTTASFTASWTTQSTVKTPTNFKTSDWQEWIASIEKKSSTSKLVTFDLITTLKDKSGQRLIFKHATNLPVTF